MSEYSYVINIYNTLDALLNTKHKPYALIGIPIVSKSQE